jgi:hypothetical protein
VPAVKELAAIEGADVLVQHPTDQVIERVGRGVGFLGQPGLDDRDHIAGVDQFPGPLDALGLDGFVVVDLVGGGDIDNEVESVRHTWLTPSGLTEALPKPDKHLSAHPAIPRSHHASVVRCRERRYGGLVPPGSHSPPTDRLRPFALPRHYP